MTRLVDLEPRWVTGIRSQEVEFEGRCGTGDRRGHIGVSFLCPHCRERRLAVFFDPPIDDGVLHLFAAWASLTEGKHIWQRTGETFDTLTLAPSVDASQSGHWHGFITNGNVT